MQTPRVARAISLVLFLIGSHLAIAQGLPPSDPSFSFDPPAYCGTGLIESDEPITLWVGYEVPESDPTIPPWEVEEEDNVSVGSSGTEYSFLNAVAPMHFAIGREVWVKGDGFFVNDWREDVFFYDSLTGYAGADSTNLDGNAYLTYTVQENNRAGSQRGWFWVIRDIYAAKPWCSRKPVYFQYPPIHRTTVHSTIRDGRVEGVIYFDGSQDPYFSKNALDSQPIGYEIQSRVIARWTGSFCDVVEDQTTWESAWSVGASIRPDTQYSFSNLDCQVQYRSRSFDGVYRSNWVYDTVTYQRGSDSGGGAGGGDPRPGPVCRRGPCDDER